MRSLVRVLSVLIAAPPVAGSTKPTVASRLRIPPYTAIIALVVCAAGFSLGDLFTDTNATEEPLTGTYTLTGPLLDLVATADGSILVAAGPNMIKEIRQNTVESFATIPVDEGVLVNGLALTRVRQMVSDVGR